MESQMPWCQTSCKLDFCADVCVSFSLSRQCQSSSIQTAHSISLEQQSWQKGRGWHRRSRETKCVWVDEVWRLSLKICPLKNMECVKYVYTHEELKHNQKDNTTGSTINKSIHHFYIPWQRPLSASVCFGHCENLSPLGSIYFKLTWVDVNHGLRSLWRSELPGWSVCKHSMLGTSRTRWNLPFIRELKCSFTLQLVIWFNSLIIPEPNVPWVSPSTLFIYFTVLSMSRRKH